MGLPLLNVELSWIYCCDCGVVIAMPDRIMNRLRENGKVFYCINGHDQHFGKNRVKELEEQLERQKRKTEFARNEANAERARAERIDRSRRAVSGHLTRTKKRIAAGVCPCCKRNFQNLRRHMENKHPGYADKEAQG